LYHCNGAATKTKNKMKTETMKLRTEKELTKMGFSTNEVKSLIEKFWNQVEYLKTAREKALYMTA
jgi:hypothetical protein